VRRYVKTVQTIGGMEEGEGVSEQKEDVPKNLEVTDGGGVAEVVVERNLPPVRWSNTQILAWLGLTHIAHHIIQFVFSSHHFLNSIASCDVASNLWPAVARGFASPGKSGWRVRWRCRPA
jgi:hypothetical protein